MRRASILVLILALALLALAPAALAVNHGPVYVGCETEGGGRGTVRTTSFKVTVNGDTVHERPVDECPAEVLKA